MHPTVGAEGVGHDRAAEAATQHALGRLGGAVFIQEEQGQIVVAGIPHPIVLAVVTPARLIGMNHREGLDFLAQVFIERGAATGGLPLEAIGAGGHEFQAEEISEEAADFALGHIQLIAQIDRRGLGGRADIATGQFPRAGLEDQAMASTAASLLVDKAGGHGAGFQHDVLLHVLMERLDRLQVGALAMGADVRGGHRHDLIDGLGRGPLPGRMAHGSSTFFWAARRRRGGVGRSGRGAAFKLAAVERLVLSLQLLDCLFQFLDAAVRLVQLLLAVLDLLLIAFFQSRGGLIPAQDQAGGQATQRRAGMPVRADPSSIQRGESAHA